jgi:hypothetical protein
LDPPLLELWLESPEREREGKREVTALNKRPWSFNKLKLRIAPPIEQLSIRLIHVHVSQ